MDEQTALVLALQLVALFSIAGALLLYLICKIKAETGLESDGNSPGAGKPVLVTSCDNAIGLQIAIHLANRGFRVFAGLREGAAAGETSDSASSRVIRSWQKHREGSPGLLQGTLLALPLDVTREDLLHESVDIIRAHLPAGKDGLWAVINTSGVSYRGRLEQQDIAHWDAILKTNVIGVLRTARTFQGLLRNTAGRIITIGASAGGGQEAVAGMVAYTASRYAVEGASNALRDEFAPLGIKVISLNPAGIQTDHMFSTPKVINKPASTEITVDISDCLDFQPIVLSQNSLQTIDIAVSSGKPKTNYTLIQKSPWHMFNFA